MEKIKNWLNEHKSLIIGLLIVLLLFKNCSSCTQERQYEYKENNYIETIDSLYFCIDSLNNEIDSLNDVIEIQLRDITYLNSSNETYSIAYKNLTESNKNLQHANSVLINTNKKLTEKRDTIN